MELHPKPKSPIQINRTLVITIGIVVVTILLLAIIGALTTSTKINHTKTNVTQPLDKGTDKLVVSPELSNLPENYTDVAGIKKFSPDSSSSQLDSLVQQLNELQSEYALLKQQLSQKEHEPEKLPEDPRSKEARTSNLVFGGLGSKAENLLGSLADGRVGGSPMDAKDKDGNLVPTAQQEEFFKKQSQDAQKLAVMKGKDNPEDIYDLHNVVKPASKYQIQAGTLIPATLINGVDSSLPGPLIAQVRSDLYDTVTGKYLLIPKGSKLIGEYDSRNIGYGQRRVLLAFNRIIRPDGTSILLGTGRTPSFGLDSAGQSGIEGNVDNHWARILGTASIASILAVGTALAGDPNPNTQRAGIKERATGAVASRIGEIGSHIANRAADMPPTINLIPGAQFFVAVRKDIVMTPFKPRRY